MALSNKKNFFRRIIFHADDGLRQRQLWTNLLNQELRDLSSRCKYLIMLNCIHENTLRDFADETGRNDAQKLLQLFLIVQIALGPQQIVANQILDARGQVHVLHGRVRAIKLLDEFLTSLVQLLEDNRNCTKHISIEKGAENKNDTRYDKLLVCDWNDIIAAKS